MPPSAVATKPWLAVTAPVYAPRTCPKSWASMKCAGMVPQWTVTMGPLARSEASWSMATTSSLPVPFSPVMSTVQLDEATRSTVWTTSRMPGCGPTILPWLVVRSVERALSVRATGAVGAVCDGSVLVNG